MIDFPARVFLKHRSKMTGDCYVFKFLRRSVDETHLMHFKSENAVFKFVQRSVEGVWETFIMALTGRLSSYLQGLKVTYHPTPPPSQL